MKIIDAHVHVFPNMQGFRGEGELILSETEKAAGQTAMSYK